MKSDSTNNLLYKKTGIWKLPSESITVENIAMAILVTVFFTYLASKHFVAAMPSEFGLFVHCDFTSLATW